MDAYTVVTWLPSSPCGCYSISPGGGRPVSQHRKWSTQGCWHSVCKGSTNRELPGSLPSRCCLVQMQRWSWNYWLINKSCQVSLWCTHGENQGGLCLGNKAGPVVTPQRKIWKRSRHRRWCFQWKRIETQIEWEVRPKAIGPPGPGVATLQQTWWLNKKGFGSGPSRPEQQDILIICCNLQNSFSVWLLECLLSTDRLPLSHHVCWEGGGSQSHCLTILTMVRIYS